MVQKDKIKYYTIKEFSERLLHNAIKTINDIDKTYIKENKLIEREVADIAIRAAVREIHTTLIAKKVSEKFNFK